MIDAQTLQNQINHLREKQVAYDTTLAVVETKLNGVQKSVDRLENTVSRVGWAIVLAVIASVLGLVLL